MHTVARRVITAPSPIIGEGVVASTAITAGGVNAQHVEGVVVSTAITAGGIEANHSETLVGQPLGDVAA